MSMISEQIQALRDLSAVYIGNGLPKVFADAADTIEELSAKLATANMERSTAYHNGGWIPCSERLPKEETDVLVQWGEHADMSTARIRKGEWHVHGIFLTKVGNPEVITAWMPLPEPYKGVE